MFATSLTARLQCTAALLVSTGRLSQYEQEAYEAHRRLVDSGTYPGPIRAATPGDTQFYAGSIQTILPPRERHYWRAVVDDIDVQPLMPLRVRFKTQVWVTAGWETRMQVIQIMTSPTALISEVIKQVRLENHSPYLCATPFRLVMEGKELDENKTLAYYEINEYSNIDAVEETDHLSHTAAQRLKDWNVDEITEAMQQESPYREMHMQPSMNLAPRYEGKPAGFYGRNDYSGMKQRSS